MLSKPTPPPVRIIVTDDHEWIRQILVQVVQQTLPAAEVVETEDGLAALKAYRSGRCDFLITNHSMPHLDGAELIRLVRQETPGLPIVMVSVKPEVESEALAAGATWFLTKTQIMERLPNLLLRHTRHVTPD